MVRRSPIRTLAVAMLIAMIALQAFLSVPVARAGTADATTIRFEGYIRAQGPTKWVVGNDLEGNRIIIVNASTAVIEKSGPAVPGAWVIVFASARSTGELDALLIVVDRPAGSPGPQVQFVGRLVKVGAAPPSWWVVDDTPVEVTAATVISGTATVDAMAWVGATMTPNGLRAGWIRVLADRPTIEFRGTLTAIGTDYRIIDGRRVSVTASTEIIGDEQVGRTVECQAMRLADGTLVATYIRVLISASEPRLTGSIVAMRAGSGVSSVWDVVLDPSDPVSNPRVVRINVDLNTWVDQTRSVAEVGKWVEVRGTPLQTDTYQASLVRVARTAPRPTLASASSQQTAEASVMPWGTPTTIALNQPNVAHPVIAFTSDRVGHAVWDADGRLYYASRAPGGTWSSPQFIAYGFAPHMVADSSNALHVTYVNLFMGNYEIYYLVRRGGSWSLPINMSYTTGYSAQPRLALTKDQRLHAVWMDNTPGYWTTYYATFDGTFWSNRPVPSGRGQAPAIATAADGTIYLVWQDRVARNESSLGDFDIFLCELRDGVWSPPFDISDSRGVDSLGADVATTPDGQAHIVWVDGEWAVLYSYGRQTAWTWPQVVSLAAGYAGNPRIAVEAGRYLHVAWEEEGEGEVPSALRATAMAQGATTWPPGYMINGNSVFKDLYLTAIPGGGVGLSWTELNGYAGASIRASLREPMRSYRLWLPGLFQSVAPAH
ncbi:MAG: DUF5666 domain-containing protein [Anaerolineae bacterium]